MNKFLTIAGNLVRSFWKDPVVFSHALNQLPAMCDAFRYIKEYSEPPRGAATVYATPEPNPLWDYFQNNKVGPGIWKREHYFEAYNRHLGKFVGKKVNLLEIGVFSGGSLKMWRTYLGGQSHIYGMDIEPACKSYESDRISVLIGDQSNRDMWKSFRENVGEIDILIDDGGHTVEQQRTSLEEMLPFLRPGGVYICEDIHGDHNKFASFSACLVHGLNRVGTPSPPFQSSVFSVHFYPYLLVIEKHAAPVLDLPSCRNGTEWQPFFDWMKDAPGKVGPSVWG